MQLREPFSDLKPPLLWKHFSEILRIPRESQHEQNIVEYIRNWAAGRRYPVLTDPAGNICVQVEASGPELRNAPVLVLQSHLDMVWEQTPEYSSSVSGTLINAVRLGDWIQAENTTLGADNGIGIAAMLSLAEHSSSRHGPLDLLFTVDEETGLTGAKSLDPRILRGRVLLNLDTEEEGTICIGCAGAWHARVLWASPRAPVPPEFLPLTLTVNGLKGGHSGAEIIGPRLNAIRALSRLLSAAPDIELQLAHIVGGGKTNSIPREASADLFVRHADQARFHRSVATEEANIRLQYAGREDGLRIRLDPSPRRRMALAWPTAHSRSLVNMIGAMPTGVWSMSPDVPHLVETSSSIGIIATAEDQVQIDSLVRSMRNISRLDVLHSIQSAVTLAGGVLEVVSGYPGWAPNLDSHVLAVAKTAFKREFGIEPRVTAVHVGLEAGVITERASGLDAISFGPEIRGVHAPGECVSISSVERFWQLLTSIVSDLAG